VLCYPLYNVGPEVWLGAADWSGQSWAAAGILAALMVSLLVGSGGLAAAWSGAPQPWRRIGLGALAGWLAALTLFCSLGAATGGALGLGYGFRRLGAQGIAPWTVAETLWQITAWTHRLFWGLTLGGILLGALGGWRFAPATITRRTPPAGKADPMMALNVSLTALPAATLAVWLAVGLYSWLTTRLSLPRPSLLHGPLTTALLLYLAAQLALLGATSHEARQATHRCGLDEVKMAAYVGVVTPVLLIAGLGWLNWPLLGTPLVLLCLLFSLGLLARQIRVLYTAILPRRAQLPLPVAALEATFFGTIATARWQPLTLLCLGGALLIVAPLYVVGAAALSILFIPLSTAPALITVGGLTAATPHALVQRLYLVQALTGWGAILGLAAALTVLYLGYAALGRRFREQQQRPSNPFVRRE